MTDFDQQVTFLLVADLDASTHFYRDLIGLEQVLDQGDCRIFRTTPTAFIGICERAQRADPASVLVTLVTDDVDGTHASLTAAGVPCERNPQVNDTYNVYHTFSATRMGSSSRFSDSSIRPGHGQSQCHLQRSSRQPHRSRAEHRARGVRSHNCKGGLNAWQRFLVLVDTYPSG